VKKARNWARLWPLAGAALLAGCGDAGSGGSNGGDTAILDRAVRVQQLMANEVQPTAEVYWNSAGYVIDENGETDLTPTTDEGWAATLESTRKLQQLGQLLQTPEYAEGRGEDWIAFSKSLVEISKRAEQTAIDRDSDAIFEVGGIIYRVCTACHQVYPASQPEDLGQEDIEEAPPA
jgi:hypothetical protein